MKKIIYLENPQARAHCAELINSAPDGWRVEIRPPSRTLAQNAAMWARLNDISRQVEWHGCRLSSDDWKNLFSAVIAGQRIVPGIEGGFVAMGQSTSSMSKAQLSDMMELMASFGAERNVVWSDE